MGGAPLHFQSARTRSIAITAARTTRTVVVNRQADSAERTSPFDYIRDCRFHLAAQRLDQGDTSISKVGG